MNISDEELGMCLKILAHETEKEVPVCFCGHPYVKYMNDVT